MFRRFIYLALFILSSTPMLFAKDFDPSFQAWNNVLSQYTKDGLVDYQRLKKNPPEWKKALINFSLPSREDYSSWTEAEKKAYLINAYNAAAIKLVLEHYPLKRSFGWKAFMYPENSIQQIPGVWKLDLIPLFGEKISLDDIGHGMLRKDFRDPRIHFALVCASIGCPKLRSEAYTAFRLKEQLDGQTILFLSNPRQLSYDTEKNVLFLSSIFKWFQEDFKNSEGSVLAFIQKHTLDRFPPEVYKAQIKYLDYDWHLNDLNLVKNINAE